VGGTATSDAVVGVEDNRPGKDNVEDASAAVAEVVSDVIDVDAVVDDEDAVVQDDADDEEERVALWWLWPKRKN
jgi:hypothetical protein